MAWLARSIANSLKLEDEEDDDYYKDPEASSTKQPKPESEQNQTDPQSSSSSPSHSHSSSSTSHTPRGVKEDLSELTKTLTRQFWGVASFLAPPPPPDRPEPGQPSDQPEQHQPLDPDGSDEDMIAGIRSDFAEIGGKFRTGISKLSSNMAVSEITKIASNLLHFGSEEGSLDNYAVGNAVGVTEEVVLFAKDIAMHPETWLDFPLPDNEAFEEFDMSDAQQEHALAVERLAPRLANLRIELCPGYMSEGCFWKIYFVLLHPRLSKHDAELLSTIQIVEARAMLSHELQTRTNEMAEPNKSGISPSYSKEPADIPCEEPLSMPSGPSLFPSESASDKTSFIKAAPSIDSTDSETEKHLVQNTEMQFIDKSVIEEESAHQSKPLDLPAGPSRILNEKFEDDGDDWLKEENSELVGMAGTSIPLGNDEDVSFSDLEDDDGDVPISYKKVTSGSDSSGKESRDWVQLGRSSTDSVKDINSVGEKHAGSGEVSLPNTETKEPNDWLDVDDIEVM